MPRVLLLVVGLLWASFAVSAERLPVLFLGDDGHHRPPALADVLIPALAERGIDVTYTDDVQSLNARTLAAYRCLIVYANIDALPDREAKVLLDYVAAGGGFVPLHCASFCFRNQPDVVALIGGQFQSHGFEKFATKTIAPEHPIMRGLSTFVTEDETYVHHLHNEKDRVVLQVREDKNGSEPWTWVRTHGKGRVFYTAYGHDERTWKQPGFVDLVDRGLRWASGQDPIDTLNLPTAAQLAARNLPPFEYVDAEIPNYLRSDKWGQMGEPIRKMQQPLSPEESLRRLVLPEGFRAELFVSESQIGKPLAMNWDDRGRLWLCETVDYPNDLAERGAGHDRITICEDSDGDGRADKFTVFAENLSIPTSIAFAHGGVIVHQAPDTLFFQDVNGDDRIDEAAGDIRKVLLTGWGTGDTHAGPSNLHMGMDGWLYSMVGYSGFDGVVGGEHHKFAMGLLRFKPDGSKLEFLRSTNNNSWGVGLSEEGLLFGSTANGCPSVFMPIPNRYYERVRGWSPTVLENIATDSKFHPITENVRQVDWFGGFTAGAGHALYTARNYPEKYWNRTAFVAEPTGHLVATFQLHSVGSDFRASYQSNLLASDDEWTAPIAAEVGPDGNVWVIDWYNFIVQHNPTPEGFKTGKRGAYETPLRDKTRGRIYRVVHKDPKPTETAPRWVTERTPSVHSLLEGLKHTNLFWRLATQDRLIARGNPDVVGLLLSKTENANVDSLGLNPQVSHALWTLAGLRAFEPPLDARCLPYLYAALKHPAAGVRRSAVTILPASPQSLGEVLDSGLLVDADCQVRLAAFLAVADMPTTERVGSVLLSAMSDKENLADRWIPHAATSAAAVHAVSWLVACTDFRQATFADEVRLGITSRVAEHFARDGKADVSPLLESLPFAKPEIAAAIVQGLSVGWAKANAPKLTPSAEESLVKLIAVTQGDTQTQLLRLANTWQVKSFAALSEKLVEQYRATVDAIDRPDAERSAAAEQWMSLRPNDLAPVEHLLSLVGPRISPELTSDFIRTIGRSQHANVGSALAKRLSSLTPGAKRQAVVALVGSAAWVPALLDTIEQKTLDLGELSLDQKQALVAHPDASIAARAKELLAHSGGLPDANRQRVIEELAPTVLAKGDAANGKLVFKTQCAKCHMHSGEGNKIGPELTGMAVHPKQELLVHLLDPSRSVEGNYRQYTVVTSDGKVLSGLLAAESKTTIELLDAENKRHTLLREEIDELVTGSKSLMPEGFEKQVPPEAIRDLLEFLTQRGKFTPLDLAKVATAASTRGMFLDPASSVERLVFDEFTPKQFAGVPFTLIDPQGEFATARVNNVVLLRGPKATLTEKLPSQISLAVNGPAKAIHLLSGVGGWCYPLGQIGSQTMIVRLHYADSSTEDHELKNGIHFADYISAEATVPQSQLAFNLHGQQVRYLAVVPTKQEIIEAIDFIKGSDDTAPIVVAVTVESP